MKASFDPDRDIPSLSGKVILITGANTGLGKETALQLAKHGPAELWVASRSPERTKPAIEEIQAAASEGVAVRYLQLDLASFDSVKAAARTFLASASRLDIFIGNGATLGGPPGLTPSGYELRFGTNHMGHALLIKLLLPLLLRTAEAAASPKDVRVLLLSSEGHKYCPKEGITFDVLKTSGAPLSSVTLYSESKLANLLHAQSLALLYPQFTTVPVNPGSVRTGLFTPDGGGILIRFLNLIATIIGVSVAEGAKSSLWVATSPDPVPGEYYSPVGVAGKGGPFSRDPALRDKLWEWTEKELEGHTI